MGERRTEGSGSKAGRWIRRLCAAALLLICISAMSAGVYARYAAVYRATHDVRLRVESGTYAVVLHYGEGYTHSQDGQSESEQSEGGADHDIYSFICRKGEQVVLPAVSAHYTRTGYAGSGWNTVADGSGTDYPDGYTGADLAEGGTTLNLYAQWSANSYQVHYAANLPERAMGAASGMQEDAVWAYDGSCELPSSPDLAGYVFTGWFTDAACTLKLGDAGEDLKKPNLSDTDGDIVTVYAGWSPGIAQYRVNHLIQRLESAGKAILSEQDYELADSMIYSGTTDSEVTPDTVPRSGYASPPVSSGRIANDGSGEWNYYYTLIPYTLTLDANTGESEGDAEIYSAETVYYGQTYSLTERIPTRQDYVFLGWHTQAEGGEEISTVEITGSLHLYARWREDIVTVTYHQNLLPQGYTPVSWIAGDGESYIRTDVTPDEDTQIRVAYETDAESRQSAGIFGTAAGAGYYAALEDGGLRLVYGAASDADAGTAQEGVRTYDASPFLSEDTDMSSGRHVIYANRHVWKTDTQDAAVFAYAPFETSDKALIFGASGVSGYFRGRIYGAQFMSKNRMIASLIPAVNGAGEPGMYDITSGYFLRNAGTGEFAVGAEVVSERQETIRGRSIQTAGDTYEANGYCLAQWNTRGDGSGTGYAPESYIEPQEDMELYAIWEHAIPTLKAEHAWFDSTVGGNQSEYTEIHIVDTVSKDIAAEAEAVWNADDADSGAIRCYKLADKLWIAGNGTGAIRVPQDARGLFNGMTGHEDGTRDQVFYKVLKIEGLDMLDTSQCSSLAWMFSALDDSYSYTSIYSLAEMKDLYGIEAWDISKVKSLTSLFGGMRALTTVPDLSMWHTSGVTEMDYIFARCSQLKSLDLNSWDTSAVTTLKSAFYGCDRLNRLRVSCWDTSQVEDCSYAFCDIASGSGGRYTLDLTGWTLPRATKLSGMFQQCIWLRTIYVSDKWSVNLEAEDASMFSNCFHLMGGAGTCQYSPKTGCEYAHVDTKEDPGYLTQSVPKAVAAGDLLAFTYGSGLYAVGDTYKGCTVDAVYDIPLDAASEQDIAWADAEGISRVVIERSFQFLRPQSLAYWFCGLDQTGTYEGLAYIDTSDVISMCSTFAATGTSPVLEELDLSSWKTASVADMSRMFAGQSSLRAIYAGDGWGTDAVTSSTDMFAGDTALNGGSGTSYDAAHTDAQYARIDADDAPGYLTDASKAGQPATLSLMQAASVSIAAAQAGDEDVQQKYLEVLFRYEGSLYDTASGEFSPGVSPVTGIEYASKEAWMSSEEYLCWNKECEYLKSLLYPAVSSS